MAFPLVYLIFWEVENDRPSLATQSKPKAEMSKTAIAGASLKSIIGSCTSIHLELPSRGLLPHENSGQLSQLVERPLLENVCPRQGSHLPQQLGPTNCRYSPAWQAHCEKVCSWMLFPKSSIPKCCTTGRSIWRVPKNDSFVKELLQVPMFSSWYSLPPLTLRLW